MTWRGMMVAGLLVLLSFSVSIAHAQTAGQRDPFARIGVDVVPKPVAPPAAPAKNPVRRPPVPVASLAAQYNATPFAVWLEEFKREAVGRGIPAVVLNDAFRNITPNDVVVKLDRKQPEGTVTYTDYMKGALNPRRVAKGRALAGQHAPLLAKISAHYQVPPNVIVALWGVETEFGGNKGNFSLIRSLATLAYEGRRADFFREELLHALTILRDEKVIGATLTGSWAGAMGHCQFMPSSYLKYATDWDGDGHRDIWNSVPDALASIANYMHSIGWDNTQPWGYAVRLPAGFDAAQADLYKTKTIAEWRALGVTTAKGGQLPGNAADAVYVMFPGTPEEGAFLVTENYHRILQWNRSRYFANSVGLLSDALAH